MSDDWQVVEEALNLRMVIAGRPEGDVKMAEAQIALARLREREAQLTQGLSDKEVERQQDVIRAVEAAEARVAELETVRAGMTLPHLSPKARAALDELAERAADLLRQRMELQNNIGGYVVTVDKLCDERAEAWRKLARLEEQYEAVTRDRDAALSQVDELDEKVRELEEQLEAEQGARAEALNDMKVIRGICKQVAKAHTGFNHIDRIALHYTEAWDEVSTPASSSSEREAFHDTRKDDFERQYLTDDDPASEPELTEVLEEAAKDPPLTDWPEDTPHVL